MDQTITKEVVEILEEKFKINRNLLIEKNYDEFLTGNTFRFNGYDMVYLYLFVQEKFNIKIQSEYLVDYRFNTIHKIVDTVKKCQITCNSNYA